MDATLLRAFEAAGSEQGAAPRSVLAGLARWGADSVATGVGAVLVRGIRPVPAGAVEVGAPDDLVVVLAGPVAVAAVADGATARWSCSPPAVRAVVGAVELPPAAAGGVEQALSRTAAGERGGALLVAALDAAVAADRQLMAGRLHDGPVQELTAAQLLLDSALWGVDLPATAQPPLERGLGALRAAVASCRALMAELGSGQRG